MRPFGPRETQCGGQTIEHLAGDTIGPALFESGQPRHADVREHGDLLPPQTGGAPPGRGREADVVGPQSLTPAAQELTQFGSFHRLSPLVRS